MSGLSEFWLFYDLTSALRIQQTEKYSTVKPFPRVEEAWHCPLQGVFFSFFHLLIAVMIPLLQLCICFKPKIGAPCLCVRKRVQ
jgi:hypothetical protein